MSCTTCFEVSIPQCPSVITVKGNLTPAAIYFWIIEDKFGAKYYDEVTADEAGAFEIDCTILPDGLFTYASGQFTLEVKKTLTNCSPELMSFCVDGESESYSCIIFDFFESALGSLPTEIGCDCNDVDPPNPVPEPDDTKTFSFTNVSMVLCNHNLGRLPDVTIYDSNGTEIEGQIDNPDLNNTVITFNEPLSGTVVID